MSESISVLQKNEYVVETDYPYVIIKCKTLTEAKRNLVKLRKSGRNAGIIVHTENGNDYILNV